MQDFFLQDTIFQVLSVESPCIVDYDRFGYVLIDRLLCNTASSSAALNSVREPLIGLAASKSSVGNATPFGAFLLAGMGGLDGRF